VHIRPLVLAEYRSNIVAPWPLCRNPRTELVQQAKSKSVWNDTFANAGHRGTLPNKAIKFGCPPGLRAGPSLTRLLRAEACSGTGPNACPRSRVSRGVCHVCYLLLMPSGWRPESSISQSPSQLSSPCMHGMRTDMWCAMMQKHLGARQRCQQKMRKTVFMRAVVKG